MRTTHGTNLTALQDFLNLHLNRSGAEPLNRQLYRHLKQAILTGKLPAGSPLPATRSLCSSLQLARNTVLNAYGQLEAEGYVQGRTGAGTYVSQVLPDLTPIGKNTAERQSHSLPMSQRAETLLAELRNKTPSGSNIFLPGVPDTSVFPWDTWQRIRQRHQRAISKEERGYVSNGGHDALKKVLAHYLKLSRGIECDFDQILITSSMQQALHLIALTTADHGDLAWIEEPGYPGARFAFQATGLKMIPVPTDHEGLMWRGNEPNPRLIYVTPSHQYPIGCVMSLARRSALLDEALKRNAWIVEDDYDSEFRHDGKPLAAMQGLDKHERVIYLGTFSKVLFPALRMGYLVTPKRLIKPLTQLQARLMREGSYVDQATLAEFIEQGYFGSHIRRMRAIYAKRQVKLRNTLFTQLGSAIRHAEQPDPGQFALLGGAAGLHLTLRLPKYFNARELSTELAVHGMFAPPLDAYCIEEPPFPGLVIGYGGSDDASTVLAAVQLSRLLLERKRPA